MYYYSLSASVFLKNLKCFLFLKVTNVLVRPENYDNCHNMSVLRTSALLTIACGNDMKKREKREKFNIRKETRNRWEIPPRINDAKEMLMIWCIHPSICFVIKQESTVRCGDLKGKAPTAATRFEYLMSEGNSL